MCCRSRYAPYSFSDGTTCRNENDGKTQISCVFPSVIDEVVHLPSCLINGPFPEPSAPDRRCHITRKLTFTVAIFRSWRGSRAFAVWNPSFTTSGTGWYHQPGPLAGIQPAGGDLRFGRGPRALRLARQRRGRDSNSRSFRIRTFQARAIDQLGDLSRDPTRGANIKGGESEIRTHEARYQRAYSISSRALSTNSAISPNETARLRGLEPLATRSAIWCSIQTELQAHK